jgi:lipopolysaccharide cholinephosphotransferase
MIGYYLLTILIMALIYVTKYRAENIPTHYTSKKVQTALLKTLDDMHKLFTQMGIEYVISFGTLLGAVRHQGLIPWDDDADIIVHKRHRPMILKLKEPLAKMGYRLVTTWKLDRIHCTDKEIPFIDIFYIEFDKKGVSKRCTLKGPECNSINEAWWWKHQPTRTELFPRKLYKFNNITLYGPYNPIAVLNKEYGKSYLTQCKTHNWDHNTSKPIKPRDIPCGPLGKPQIPKAL